MITNLTVAERNPNAGYIQSTSIKFMESLNTVFADLPVDLRAPRVGKQRQFSSVSMISSQSVAPFHFKQITKNIVCRICLEEVCLQNLILYNKKNFNNMIILPCGCKGTSGYIHQVCVKTWIESNCNNTSNPICEICKEEYSLVRTNGDITKEEKRKIVKHLSVLFIMLVCINIILYVLLFKADFDLPIPTGGYIAIFITINCLGLLIIYIFTKKDLSKWKVGKVIGFEVVSKPRALFNNSISE